MFFRGIISFDIAHVMDLCDWPLFFQQALISKFYFLLARLGKVTPAHSFVLVVTYSDIYNR
jgi:hypothetical protein